MSAARRLASRLHRLRRGRPADRGGAPQAVLRAAARRDREGPPGRLQHPAADPRGRPADRLAGPHGRLPPRDRDHDLEHRGARRSRATRRSASRSATTRPGITYDDMKNRIMGELKKVFRPEFLNRIDDVIVFHKLQKDEIKTDRRAAAAADPRVAGRARAAARADRGGQGPPGREGLGPGDGRPPAAPGDPALHRGPARRLRAALASSTPGATVLVERGEGPTTTPRSGEALDRQARARARRRSARPRTRRRGEATGDKPGEPSPSRARSRRRPSSRRKPISLRTKGAHEAPFQCSRGAVVRRLPTGRLDSHEQSRYIVM